MYCGKVFFTKIFLKNSLKKGGIFMTDHYVDDLQELKKDFPLMRSLIKGFHSEDSLGGEERKMFFDLINKYRVGGLVESMVAFPDSFENRIISGQGNDIPEAVWNWCYNRQNIEVDVPLGVFLGVYFCLNIAGQSSKVSLLSELMGINQLGSDDEAIREMIAEKYPKIREIKFPSGEKRLDEWLADCREKCGDILNIKIIYKKIK